MHKYLNAIGYGGLASEKQLNRLLQYAEKVYTHHELMALDQETDYCEYRMKSSKAIIHILKEVALHLSLM